MFPAAIKFVNGLVPPYLYEKRSEIDRKSKDITQDKIMSPMYRSLAPRQRNIPFSFFYSRTIFRWAQTLDTSTSLIDFKRRVTLARAELNVEIGHLHHATASFYYYYQNPLGVCFLLQISGFCYLNLTRITKFKCERKTWRNNSGLSSKILHRANGLL